MTLCPMPLVCTTRKDTSVLPAALSIIAIVSNPSADDRGWPATVRPMSAPEDRTAEAGLYALLIVNRWSRMRSHSSPPPRPISAQGAHSVGHPSAAVSALAHGCPGSLTPAATSTDLSRTLYLWAPTSSWALSTGCESPLPQPQNRDQKHDPDSLCLGSSAVS